MSSIPSYVRPSAVRPCLSEVKEPNIQQQMSRQKEAPKKSRHPWQNATLRARGDVAKNRRPSATPLHGTIDGGGAIRLGKSSGHTRNPAEPASSPASRCAHRQSEQPESRRAATLAFRLGCTVPSSGRSNHFRVVELRARPKNRLSKRANARPSSPTNKQPHATGHSQCKTRAILQHLDTLLRHALQEQDLDLVLREGRAGLLLRHAGALR